MIIMIIIIMNNNNNNMNNNTNVYMTIPIITLIVTIPLHVRHVTVRTRAVFYVRTRIPVPATFSQYCGGHPQ